MKCSVFAMLAMLAMAGALTEARQLQSNTYTPTPAKTVTLPSKLAFIPAKVAEGKTILTAIFMYARPQIEKVLKNGGVPVIDAAIANALFGNAFADSTAKAKNVVGPAKALSDAVAQAVWGNAKASAAAQSKAVLGNTKAMSSALANAIKGMATATSQADGSTIFGAGLTFSEAQANAICGPAWAASGSSCSAKIGGCESVSNAIAMAFKGDATSSSTATADCHTLPGKPCKASSKAQSLAIFGSAKASSSSAASNQVPGVLAALLEKKLKGL